MTDPDVIARKLAVIETAVADLRTIARVELLGSDVREQRFVEHTLQIAIQAAIDVASHIGSDARAGEPQTSRDVFAMLARREILPREFATRLGKMAGFRNILVHGYADVDIERVRHAVEHELDDLLAFVTHIRALL